MKVIPIKVIPPEESIPLAKFWPNCNTPLSLIELCKSCNCGLLDWILVKDKESKLCFSCGNYLFEYFSLV